MQQRPLRAPSEVTSAYRSALAEHSLKRTHLQIGSQAAPRAEAPRGCADVSSKASAEDGFGSSCACAVEEPLLRGRGLCAGKPKEGSLHSRVAARRLIALRRLLRHLASTLQVRLPALQAGCLHHVYDLQPVCGQLNVALDVGARDCVCNCIREGFMCAAPGAHYPPAGTHDDVHVLRVSP
eukprot:CAMPEP_0170653688 /NCGR_PEP_ID=MMETSP0224-20130122/47535_1 /TAXON_ID=285029 /ORGANISM="Togula jolla, Strain CCCM 725" /LENGTH=180 /DNA_ID=CAMNT_0010985565 /DNA_START=285 /DNA_END=829 /DNA_ORIENTATION=+